MQAPSLTEEEKAPQGPQNIEALMLAQKANSSQ
jgi:hypothetical protein